VKDVFSFSPQDKLALHKQQINDLGNVSDLVALTFL
jgi:hypothetical protein